MSRSFQRQLSALVCLCRKKNIPSGHKAHPCLGQNAHECWRFTSRFCQMVSCSKLAIIVVMNNLNQYREVTPPIHVQFLTLGLFGERVIVVTCVCPSVRLSVPIILVNTITQSVYPISPPKLLGGFNMALSCHGIVNEPHWSISSCSLRT